MAMLSEKRVLITGSSGFIARHLALELLDRGTEVFGVDRSPAPDGSALFQVDLLDPAATRQLIEEMRPDYIFHLAGVIHANSLEELYRGNVEPTLNLLEALKASRAAARVVIPGSAAEYGKVALSCLPLDEERLPDPVSPYGVVKAWQTTLARFYATQGVEVMLGRIFNVIGRGIPETLSIGAFAAQLKKIKRGGVAPRMAVGNLQPRRDFIDASDACRGLIAVAEHGVAGEVYNICSGSSVSMQDILRLMIGHTGLEVEIQVDPARLKAGEIDDSYGSYGKLAAASCWSPVVSIAESIERVMG